MPEYTTEEYRKALEIACARIIEDEQALQGYAYGTIEERVQHFLAEALQ
jgi:hypothetical protein